MEKELLKKLLDVVSTQQTKQAGIDAKYNIFYALRIWSKEVTLHSRIIVDLLNPKGYHKMGAKFLELFLKKVGLIGKFDFSDKDIEVVDEKCLPKQRRIDIFLKDSTGNVIVIENKIYAGDQEQQLKDYHDFGLEQTANKKLSVLYLTLTGTPPSLGSLGNLKDKDYKCISYSKHILKWIKACIKESSKKPALKEVLKQYKRTIEYLTKTNMETQNKILSLSSGENFNNLIALSDIVQSIKNDLPRKVGEALKKELKNFNPSEEDGYIYLKTDIVEKNKNIVADDNNKVRFRIKPSTAPWCGFVECTADKKCEVQMSKDVVDLFRQCNIKGKLYENKIDYWWRLYGDIFELSIESIKNIINGESSDEIKEWAKEIRAELEKLNENNLKNK